jgi:hypothetical protein
MFVPHRKHRTPLSVTEDSVAFLYVHDVRTSQEAQAFTVCYGESFTFLYIDDVLTSQEAHSFTVRYRGSFIFLCR